jgi:hypothetical protein
MEDEVAAATHQQNVATDAAEHVEMQLNNNDDKNNNSNTQTASASTAVRATSVYTDEQEKIGYNEQHQKPPHRPPTASAAPPTTTPQTAGTGIVPPLTRVYLAGIPPAKPYRRITYTEWSPSSESTVVSIPDFNEVEKKVKTTKCIITSFLLSIALYTFCFLIIPLLVYIGYVIFYVIQQNNNEGDEGNTDDTLPINQEDIEDAVPCPYPLAQRDECG